jgi:dGTPase
MTPMKAQGTGRIHRAEIEAREDAQLAPWAMRCAGSRGRVHEEPEHTYRTVYMRDRDRVVHCSAFRRLEYKTQVFVNHEGDYYRTRLTHSMEVAQISRTVARAMRLNEDLTETIALSHDVGHGPFGHRGEHVLRELMKEHGGFEHNAHGLRVVDVLERRYPRWPGLNLSFEVREAFALHSPHTKELGFVRRRPLLEAQLVDVCDGLTYCSHDMDDGIASGILTPEGLRDAELWREHWDRVVAEEPDLARPQQVLATVRRVIDAMVGDLVESSLERLEASGVRSPEDVQEHAHLLVAFGEDMNRAQRRLTHHLHEHFYNHPRLLRMGLKAKRLLTSLFEVYRSEPRVLSAEERAWAGRVGLERAICDKLAAMTDREAQDEYARLFEPFERL